MTLADLRRKKPTSVMGLDVSTKSIAFAIFKDGKPYRCGEIFLFGDDEFARAADAMNKVKALMDIHILEADQIVHEKAVFVNNIQVLLKLSYIFGAVVAALGGRQKVWGVTPIAWQSALGNKTLNKAEKQLISEANPDKSKTWLKNEEREFRKARTMMIAREYFVIHTDSDNVSDSVGIALWLINGGKDG